jgi:hypothetical protein
MRGKPLTHEYLLSAISYDPITGAFRWIERRKGRRRDAVGTPDCKEGYWLICIDSRMYRRGRLAFLYITGRWPEGQIDQKNLNKADDRWENLREASKSENMFNLSVRANSGTGVKHVQRQKGGTLVVRITANKIRHDVGTYRTIEEAIAARDAVLKNLHGEFARV